ncbi:MAG: hypothetical protein JNK89_05120 [Saprospiraceae bacterium]|nr:hypothetical protein [Saprospiraceae bacterium]
MKQASIIMLKSILLLFGCKNTPRAVVESEQFGPFTIRLITDEVQTLNMNKGTFDQVKRLHYELDYQGQPFAPGDSSENAAAAMPVWRVFTLKDAPKPSLLAFGESLFLVTGAAERGKAESTVLDAPGARFTSLQWLDSAEAGGIPGEPVYVYRNESKHLLRELTGGRYLLLNGSVVLDVQTFKAYAFRTDQYQFGDYFLLEGPAVGFSAEAGQLALLGAKNNAADDSLLDYALVCFDFQTKKSYAVPLESKTAQPENDDSITAEWLRGQGEWGRLKNGTWRLQLRAAR